MNYTGLEAAAIALKRWKAYPLEERRRIQQEGITMSEILVIQSLMIALGPETITDDERAYIERMRDGNSTGAAPGRGEDVRTCPCSDGSGKT